MGDNIAVFISDKPLDVADAVSAVTDPAHGAVDLFIGTVRNRHEGRVVTGITYDAHQTLAEKTLYALCQGAAAIWPGTVYHVSHYVGSLPVGGISVLIAVGSAHRAESFEACRYVIEEIKIKLPVWKQEHYVDGNSVWLPGHSLIEGGGRGDAAVG